MLEDIVVIGAGGFGRETLDVVEAINAASSAPIWRVAGIVDDAPTEIQLERIAKRGYKYLGKTAAVLKIYTCGKFAIGIGSPSARAKVAAKFANAGWKSSSLIHPDAVIGSQTLIGEGSIVCAGVQLSTNIRLGQYVHLNPGAIIGHDSAISSFVSVNPGAVVSGEVHIQHGALIGAGSVILQGLEIGSDAVVGAGACVTRNVLKETVVTGVPARTRKSDSAGSEGASIYFRTRKYP